MNKKNLPPSQPLILAQTEDGKVILRIKPQNGTVWLTQVEMAELFQTSKQNISSHLKSLFAEGELDGSRVVRNNPANTDPNSARKLQYNLEAIIAVGLRMKNQKGTLFRRWVIKRILETLAKR